MLLRNVSIVGDENTTPKEILAKNGYIHSVTEYGSHTGSDENAIFFEDAIAFSGLINSHDHLDFNLFPRLGTTVYNNYREWGTDIHKQFSEQIAAVLKIPQPLRTLWGMYKNLFNGFTTVVNHGEKLPIANDLITVCQENMSLHSVGFEKKWRWKLNRPGIGKKKYVIHVGEGTDPVASHEIDTLIRWNLGKRALVGVHGVAMNAEQASSFQGLVWCPDSNFFLLNKTAAIDQLKKNTAILFGSDSTLTSGWNICNQLRMARQTNMLTDQELFETVSGNAAMVWGLNRKGAIREGYDADIVVARKNNHKNALDAFYATDPEDLLLVMHQGQIQLFDETIAPQLSPEMQKGFGKVNSKNSCKYVAGDFATLCTRIRELYPGMELPFDHI